MSVNQKKRALYWSVLYIKGPLYWGFTVCVQEKQLHNHCIKTSRGVDNIVDIIKTYNLIICIMHIKWWYLNCFVQFLFSFCLFSQTAYFFQCSNRETAAQCMHITETQKGDVLNVKSYAYFIGKNLNYFPSSHFIIQNQICNKNKVSYIRLCNLFTYKIY